MYEFDRLMMKTKAKDLETKDPPGYCHQGAASYFSTSDAQWQLGKGADKRYLLLCQGMT